MKILLWSGILVLGNLFFLHSNPDDPDESIKRGEQVYLANCLSCHMYNGEGLAGTYPPLTNTRYIADSVPRSINIILHGQKGEVIVNDVIYNTEMPAQDYLTDEQIADVLNYVMNSWGSKGPVITPGQVKKEREK
jgi:mono/diheme cytochrome c family protein